MNTDKTPCGNSIMPSEGRVWPEGSSISHAVDRVNTQSLGLGVAYSTNLSYLSASMHGQLVQFHMVADQQRQAMLALAVTTQAAIGKKPRIYQPNGLDTMSQPENNTSPFERAMAHAESHMSAAGGAGKAEGLDQTSVPNEVPQ